MPVVVTGTGAVSALGGDVEATWNGVVDGRSAVRHWADLAAEGHALDVACRVDDAVWGGAVPAVRVRGRALARRAAREALEDAGLLGRRRPSGRRCRPCTGRCLRRRDMGESACTRTADGTGTSTSPRPVGRCSRRPSPALRYRPGPRRTYGTACAAGNYAIRAAARAVAGRSGRGRPGRWRRAVLAAGAARVRADAGDRPGSLRAVRARPTWA